MPPATLKKLSHCLHLSFFGFSFFLRTGWEAKKGRENEAEKELITWTAVHRNSKSMTIRLASGLPFLPPDRLLVFFAAPLIGYWSSLLSPDRLLVFMAAPLIGYWSSLLTPDWLLVFFAAPWLATGLLCCSLIGYYSSPLLGEYISFLENYNIFFLTLRRWF